MSEPLSDHERQLWVADEERYRLNEAALVASPDLRVRVGHARGLFGE